MATGKFSMQGIPEMRKRIQLLRLQAPRLLKAGLVVEGEIDTTEAKRRTPVYVGPTGPGKPIPGLLRSSVHLEGPFQEGRRIWVSIVAGGAAGAYAWRQHEELDWFHTIGQAKFIESVIMESRPFMGVRLANRVHLTQLLG